MKRAGRPALSSSGQYVLERYEQVFRTEEELMAVTIRNYLSDFCHFAAWCESAWKQGREEEPPFTPEAVTAPILTDCRVYPHHRFGYRMAKSVPLHRLAQLMGHDSLDTTMLYAQGTKNDLQQAVEMIAWR